MIIFASIVLYLFVFVIGICIGSFLNVLIYRIPRRLNFVTGRSFCPTCQVKLTACDLVPIFSWLFLGGTCRHCHNPISARYPLGELLCGLFASLSLVVFGATPMALITFAAVCILFVIAMIDWDTMEIPNGLILALLVPAVCAAVFAPEISLLVRGIGFFVIALPMFLLNFIIPESFGGGDIKLCAVAGFLLGWQAMLFGTFVALVLGGGYGVYLLVTRKKGRREHFAFGPFLSIGITVALYWGTPVVSWYLSLFLI